MDQNQITTNQPADNDLQKAIDSITNKTNIDPVFSDPVAAPSSIPEGDTGELDEPVGPFPAPPKIELKPSPATPAPEPTPEPTPEPAPEPTPEPIVDQSNSLNMHGIKEAALRDLVPLIDHLNMSASQKFNLYRNIFEDLKDYTVLNSAYEAAKSIEDETKKAEALLYLVETIDKM